MRVLWFLTTLSLCLQLGLTRTLQSIENNQDSGNEKTVAIPLILVYGGFHYAYISIGTPQQPFRIFFDTWNQNTWVPSTKCRIDKYPMCANHARYEAEMSASKKETTAEFSDVEYGTTVSGTITEDIVMLGGQKVRQPFGEVNATTGDTLDTATFDGIFGIGIGSAPVGRPSILESLKKSGLIDKKAFGIWAKSNAYGEIMFGGYNKKLYSGEIEFTDVLSQEEWKFGVKSIKFGNEDLTGTNCQAFVNDGSHHIYGPPQHVNKIYKALGCNRTDRCKVDCSKINKFPDLKIIVSKTEFTISPLDYIDKEGDECTGRIFDLDQPIWMFGNLFLDKVYTAYDTEKRKIGFAEALKPASTLSPTPRSTTTKTTVSTTEVPTTSSEETTTSTEETTTSTEEPTTSTEEPTTSTEGTTTSTEEPTTPTTQGPQPTTTSAASTVFSHHKSIEFLLVMAILTYPHMQTA